MIDAEKHLGYLRTLSTPEMPGFGAKLYETLSAILGQQRNLSQQLNGNPSGQPEAPPAINGINVTGQNGHFNVAIQDHNQIFRDIHYYAEYADNPHFTNPITVHMGHSRNHNLFLGNGSYYWRGYSAYSSSAPSKAAYHGGNSASPQIVIGGGGIGGPNAQASQGSGTGTPGTGLSGPGPVPFRSTTGAAPGR